MTVGVASAAYRPISLFSIYAPEDVSLHEQLEKHLSSLKRQGLITLSAVDKTLTGADRNVEIERNLNTAQIILLLLSANSLASERCNDVMMRALLDFVQCFISNKPPWQSDREPNGGLKPHQGQLGMWKKKSPPRSGVGPLPGHHERWPCVCDTRLFVRQACLPRDEAHV